MKKKVIVATAAIVGLLAAGSASANPTTFFGQDQYPNAGTTNSDTAHADFISHLSSGVGTEDFEGFSGGDTPPLTLNFPGSTGSITATVSGDGSIKDSPAYGTFATSGSTFYDTGTGGDFSLAFSSPVSAFGFYGTDISDVDELLVLTLTDTDGNTTTLNVTDSPNSENGNELFFGFIDTAASYTDVVFGFTGGSADRFGFDDMTIGDLGQVTVPPTTVPEPSVLAMFGFGLVGLLGLLRRRRV